MNDIKFDLEKAILGCFLLNDNIHMFYERLSLDIFNDELHKKIYMAMIFLFEDKIIIDPLTVMSRLSIINQDEYNQDSLLYRNQLSYVYELANECPSHSNISHYIDELALQNEKIK